MAIVIKSCSGSLNIRQLRVLTSEDFVVGGSSGLGRGLSFVGSFSLKSVELLGGLGLAPDALLELRDLVLEVGRLLVQSSVCLENEGRFAFLQHQKNPCKNKSFQCRSQPVCHLSGPVVVALLVEQSLTTPEIRSSNPNIGKILSTNCPF